MQTTRFPFRIEDTADNDIVILFYTGFSNYRRLIMCYEFLGISLHHQKYWGSKLKAPSVENRGISQALTPLLC